MVGVRTVPADRPTRMDEIEVSSGYATERLTPQEAEELARKLNAEAQRCRMWYKARNPKPFYK